MIIDEFKNNMNIKCFYKSFEILNEMLGDRGYNIQTINYTNNDTKTNIA